MSTASEMSAALKHITETAGGEAPTHMWIDERDLVSLWMDEVKDGIGLARVMRRYGMRPSFVQKSVTLFHKIRRRRPLFYETRRAIGSYRHSYK
jgi:hypothetical protein